MNIIPRRTHIVNLPYKRQWVSHSGYKDKFDFALAFVKVKCHLLPKKANKLELG